MFPTAFRLILAQVTASVLPVLVFLFALELIDTYKLLTFGRVLRSVGVGCAVAAICYGLNTGVYAVGIVSPAVWARSGAPVIEEIAKALYVAWLLRSNRVGFMVDTAISGFAVGAGFAVLENLTYIPDLSATGLAGKRDPRTWNRHDARRRDGHLRNRFGQPERNPRVAFAADISARPGDCDRNS